MKSITLFIITSFILLTTTTYAETYEEPLIRNMRPSVVSFTLGYPQVPPSISYHYNFTSQWALGGNIGSVVFLSNLEVSSRYYFSETLSSLFVQSNGGAMIGLFPTTRASISPYIGTLLGYEYRAANGFTLVGGVGAIIQFPAANDFIARTDLFPQALLSFGYAY